MPKLVITRESMPEVLHVIETWKGKLTWPLLCENLTLLLKLDGVTRQTLASYKEIQEAYTLRKQQLQESSIVDARPQDSDVEYLRNQLEYLDSELKKANRMIELYKQRFVKWQYNAYMHGIRMETLDDAVDMLEKPLTETKRRTGGS